MRTSGGTYSSERLVVRTHKMTDLSGITVTPGIMPAQLRESLEATIESMGAKLADSVRIDTTHFVCTEGRGAAWDKAVEMNVPVVVPDWVKGCEREGRIVGVRGYYLNADPRLRQIGPGAALSREESQASVTTTRSSAQTAAAPVPDATPAAHEAPAADKQDEEADDYDDARTASASASREELPMRRKEPAESDVAGSDGASLGTTLVEEGASGAPSLKPTVDDEDKDGNDDEDDDDGDDGDLGAAGEESFDDVKL